MYLLGSGGKRGGRETGNFCNGGQADFLLVLVIDPKEERDTSIQIDRDTEAEITIQRPIVLATPQIYAVHCA